MERASAARRSANPSWTRWVPLIMLVCIPPASLIGATPLARNSNKQDSATLVVTNSGTYRNGSVSSRGGRVTSNNNNNMNNNNNGGGGGSVENRRQGRQKSAADLSQWFREETREYPEEEIDRLLGKTPEALKELYNVLNTQLDPHMNLTERVAFYNDDNSNSNGNNNEEHGDAVREESVCRTVTRNIYPREARRKNSLVYIPNNQQFMQVIQAEICQHPDSECSYLRDALPYGLGSVCVQKYAYKKLLYLEAAESRMASDLFRYPSCCACYIRSLPYDLRSASNSSAHSSASGTLLFHSGDVTPGADLRPTNSSGRDESGASTESSLSSTAPSATGQGHPAGRSLNSQQQQARAKQQQQQLKAANQTVILSGNKVFETDT